MAENNKTTLAGSEPDDESQNENAPKPQELRKAKPIPNPLNIQIPNPGSQFSKAILEAARNIPSAEIMSQAAQELASTLPNIAKQYQLASQELLRKIPATTITTTFQSPDAGSASKIEPEPQSRKLEEMNRKVSEALKQVEKLQTELATAKSEAADANKVMTNDLNRVREHVGTTDAEVSRSQLKLVETLGLFVAAFGFIALSANALKDVQNGRVLSGALLIAAGLIMSFVLALDLIVRRWRYDIEAVEMGVKDMILKWILPQGVLILFVIGILFWGANLLSAGNSEIMTRTKSIPTVVATQSPSPVPVLTSSPLSN